MHPVLRQMAACWPEHSWADVHVVLAVSGGPDSVALARASAALKTPDATGRLHIAHFNHRLRGADSDADQRWVVQLGSELGLPVEVGRAANSGRQTGSGSWEADARQARYAFLVETAERLGARFVATAHTADDQVETVLHHALRGTGLAGLAGMPVARRLSPAVSLIRPLLDVRRAEVLDFLEEIGQPYRTDATNADPRFTRNRMRNELLPMLRAGYNRNVDSALLKLSQQASQAQEVIDRLVEDLLPKFAHITQSPETISIDARWLADQPALIIREFCKRAWREAAWPEKDMGFEEWQLLAVLLACKEGHPAVNLPGNIRAERRDGQVILQSGG